MDIFDTIQKPKSEKNVMICNIDDGDEVTVEDGEEDGEEDDYMDMKDEHNKPLINIEDSERNALDEEDEDASTFDAVTAVGKILIFKPRKKRARCCFFLCQKVCEKLLEFNHSTDCFIQF